MYRSQIMIWKIIMWGISINTKNQHKNLISKKQMKKDKQKHQLEGCISNHNMDDQKMGQRTK